MEALLIIITIHTTLKWLGCSVITTDIVKYYRHSEIKSYMPNANLFTDVFRSLFWVDRKPNVGVNYSLLTLLFTAKQYTTYFVQAQWNSLIYATLQSYSRHIRFIQDYYSNKISVQYYCHCASLNTFTTTHL